MLALLGATYSRCRVRNAYGVKAQARLALLGAIFRGLCPHPQGTEFLDFLLGIFCARCAYDSIYVGNCERGFI